MVYVTVMNTLVSIGLAAGGIWNAEGMKGTWRLSHNHPLLMADLDHEHPLRFVCFSYNINQISR